ncbi:MAG: hypothetical protein EZS26_000777 [Candidatus Ordinivivax streblomastigis]|uniref:Uncharacterized protein n=1 Tax=Candidatus Ordinivivax streblomastigis TaxID=2540710 RepID=A0A5M8P468_9BACT|nr:MAG: hypothetical protein EZS26_000777 [Candidatus Ordinivivax streblomastigis]
MNEKQKSEFAQKLEQTVKELTSAVEGQKGKGFIFIGVECLEDGDADSTNAVIAIAGSGRQIVEGLAQFIKNPQTRPIMDKAMNLVALGSIADLLTSK